VSSRLLVPLAASGLALLAAACSDVSGLNSASELHQQVCNSDDLGGQFREETSGDFSSGNLGALADNATVRTKELNAAGLKGGHFAYWKHTVPDPPFDPPIEAVCQVMEFGSDAEANDFVAGLTATPDDLATAAITWLPAGQRSASEEPAPAIQLPPTSRGFHLVAKDANVDAKLFVVILPAGRFVRSVYVGDADGDATLDLAAGIQRKMLERLK
jgi:hypothetical protein